MATAKKTFRTGAPAKAGPAAVAGVEPLGKVRRSQLIATYGIGAIVDLEKGSFMPMGLEDWESATRLVEQTYGQDVLSLVLARGYLVKLIDNAHITRYLKQRAPEILEQFQSIAAAASLEA